MVLVVGKCLRRSYHNTLSGMYSERVEVFHIADSDAVVVFVAHHFVFYLLPAFETFLYENLW